ncbi:MAG: NAD-dependent epimerase/dehydratase family protein [Planctomycetales bacterium]|nr:NAD-dependent epimerase/dehydratase family protein [bacterium]UNM07502.1 MAG: NAD-dependent epimerase/dehydratase family protein [Planctomycetales bacterium]
MAEGGKHVVFGANGPVGSELVRILAEKGHNVVAASRRGGFKVPAGAKAVVGDASRTEDTYRLCMGSEVVYCCVGIDYTKWSDSWPGIVSGLIEGVSNAGSRLVFADNLYSYGPVTEPMQEDLPLTSYGEKPALRAKLVRNLLRAHESGRCPTVIVKASDFYGPGVRNAMLGERVFPNALAGKPAQMLGDISKRHTYTYAPDFARALATVSSERSAFGKIWNCPSAPALSTEEVLALVYREAGTELRIQTMPRLMLNIMANFNPLLKSVREMMYQFDHDFLVDDSRFREKFQLEPTPLLEGIRATLDWYRHQADGNGNGNGSGKAADTVSEETPKQA